MATRKAEEKQRLLRTLGKALGEKPDEVVLRALRELAGRLKEDAAAEAPAASPKEAASEKSVVRPGRAARRPRVRGPGPGATPAGPPAAASAQGTAAAPAPAGPTVRDGSPQRLFLLLDGRGLDGRGLPIEVIDLPATLGSSRKSTIWINSPNIETSHLRITREAGGWVLEDPGSERGTFFGEERIGRRLIRHGDEFRLAGYLRLRAELR